ncbi:MAG: hypothetical protein A3E79_12505 [Burkholderiales bacterium RIFCSPHIGHO2_12_FULL_61_11]|nr:MAG: hypothetical protein A3E79_12505 [Burkholderiales bacterium RIFCSPHIGHO2_12_FULL_61_11]
MFQDNHFSRFNRLMSPLIPANQFGMRKNMALHGLLKSGFVGIFQIRKLDIQGEKLVEIAMPAYRRARSAVAGAPPIVPPLQDSRSKVFGGDAFRQTMDSRWQVVQHPVHPGHFWRCGVGRVRVIDDQDQALRAGRHTRPRQRWRNIITITGMPERDQAIVLKRWGGKGK